MGAALSYYALFSIAPLLLIVIGVAGYFFGEEAAHGEMYGQLASLVGPEGAPAVQGFVAAARKPQSGVLAVLVGAALLWRAPARKKTKGWWMLLRTRVLSFGMILGIAFLLMVSLVLSAAIAALGRWWGLHAIDLAMSFGLTTLLFAMIYKIMPRVRIAWRDVWVGAAVTAALFAVGKWAIGLYIGRSSVASAFGAAGSLVVAMVWVYYSAQIFLLGAEFTRVYAEAHGSRAIAPLSEASHAICVQTAANAPVIDPARPGRALARLGAALALGLGASIGVNLWRRR